MSAIFSAIGVAASPGAMVIMTEVAEAAAVSCITSSFLLSSVSMVFSNRSGEAAKSAATVAESTARRMSSAAITPRNALECTSKVFMFLLLVCRVRRRDRPGKHVRLPFCPQAPLPALYPDPPHERRVLPGSLIQADRKDPLSCIHRARLLLPVLPALRLHRHRHPSVIFIIPSAVPAENRKNREIAPQKPPFRTK